MKEHVEQNAVVVTADEVERIDQIMQQLDEQGEVLVQTAEDAGEVAPDAA